MLARIAKRRIENNCSLV